jgi:formylglycine-generating enzyme required for sulfatase activity
MKLFISYARVDKPYCVQIVNTLEVHETWYDQRLHAGQHWWKEILRRLEWCEGFIYLLSPESVESEYCKKEFELAQKLGRYIFPVLIHPNTIIPEALRELQYVDFSTGLTASAVASLFNSIYLAEQEKNPPSPIVSPTLSSETVKPPSVNPVSAISAATAAMEKGQFDHAVFLLKRAQATGHSSRFINIDAVLAEAEAGLQRQTYLREASREYDQIVHLVKFERTHKLGCEAFDAFKKHYPDYDPENLVSLCSKEPVIVVTPTAAPVIAAPPKLPDFKLPLLEWCDIPEGTLEIDLPSQNGGEGKKKVDVPAFKISRYPITNEQYKIFLDDEMGYANKKWWQFSPEGEEWRTKNPEPQPPTFRGEERPRERVNWFDAMAFCQWLSMKLGMNITLPTDVQWIRAAQGDDKRAFPWGNTFDKQKCNTRESEIKMTTLVMRYPSGASPFGVYDMAGNVWEWCQDLHVEAGSNGDTAAATKRLVHGGSFISPCQRAEIGFRYYLDPHSFHSTIGFRVIATNNPA